MIVNLTADVKHTFFSHQQLNIKIFKYVFLLNGVTAAATISHHHQTVLLWFIRGKSYPQANNL